MKDFERQSSKHFPRPLH